MSKLFTLDSKTDTEDAYRIRNPDALAHKFVLKAFLAQLDNEASIDKDARKLTNRFRESIMKIRDDLPDLRLHVGFSKRGDTSSA